MTALRPSASSASSRAPCGSTRVLCRSGMPGAARDFRVFSGRVGRRASARAAIPGAAVAGRAREAHAPSPPSPTSPARRAIACSPSGSRDKWREYGLEQVEIVEHEVLLPYPTEVQVSMPAARRRASDDVARELEGRCGRGRPVFGARRRPRLSRVLGVRRRHRLGRLRGQRQPVGLRLARRARASTSRARSCWSATPCPTAIAASRRSPPNSAAPPASSSTPIRPTMGLRRAGYPDGPWGPESHIQRGGIVYDFRVPGDPLTPGWASVPGAKRIRAAEAVSLPKISARRSRGAMRR